MASTRKAVQHPPQLETLVNEDGVATYTWWRFFSQITEFLPFINTYEIAWTPTSITAGVQEEQTIAITDLTTTDIVFINSPGFVADIVVGGARVSAAGILAVSFYNKGAGAATPISGTYKVLTIGI